MTGARSWTHTRSSAARPRRRRIPLLLDVLIAASILGLIGLISLRLDRVESVQATGVPEIVDGDTLRLGGDRIRLSGIDAPELDQTCRRDGQPYACGRLARRQLALEIGDRTVTCRGWQRDRYDRLIASCETAQGDLGAAQVSSGWAVAYGDYDSEESAARAKKLGLWAGEFTPPRDWRRQQGSLVEDEHTLFNRLIGLVGRLLWS